MTINEINDELINSLREIPGKHPKIQLLSVMDRVVFQCREKEKGVVSYIYYLTTKSDDSKYWKLPVELSLSARKDQVQSSLVNAYYQFIHQCKQFGVVINIVD